LLIESGTNINAEIGKFARGTLQASMVEEDWWFVECDIHAAKREWV
jgi:hypothetical protein